MNAGPRYRIAAFSPEHRQGVARLQRHLWRGDERTNAAYYEWKYVRCPVPERSFMLVVLHDGEVVGTRGEIAMPYEGGSPRREFLLATSADLLVDPAHRDKGLNRELASALVDGLIARDMPYSMGWSAGPRMLEWMKRTGWVEVGPLDSHWTDPAARLTHAMYRAVQKAGIGTVPLLRPLYQYLRPTLEPDPASALAAVPDRSLRGGTGRVTIAREPRPAAMAELVARMGHDGRLRQVRDERWFGWRGTDPFACNRFVYVESGRLEGYLIVQARSNRPRDHTALVDIEASDPAVLEDLLDAAMKHLAINRLVIWCATFDASMRSALERRGFHPLPRPASIAEPRAALLARRLPAADALEVALGARRVERLPDWDIRMAYSDAY